MSEEQGTWRWLAWFLFGLTLATCISACWLTHWYHVEFQSFEKADTMHLAEMRAISAHLEAMRQNREVQLLRIRALQDTKEAMQIQLDVSAIQIEVLTRQLQTLKGKDKYESTSHDPGGLHMEPQSGAYSPRIIFGD